MYLPPLRSWTDVSDGRVQKHNVMVTVTNRWHVFASLLKARVTSQDKVQEFVLTGWEVNKLLKTAIRSRNTLLVLLGYCVPVVARFVQSISGMLKSPP